MPCIRYWIRSSLCPEDIYHYIILDELVPVKAFATKVECLPGKKTKYVRTNFSLCCLHHNHLSLGSKLSFRASVFLLLQLHWKLSRNTWNNVFSILRILVILGILSSVFWHLVGGEVLEAPHAPSHLIAEPHSERFPPDQSTKYFWSGKSRTKWKNMKRSGCLNWRPNLFSAIFQDFDRASKRETDNLQTTKRPIENAIIQQNL